MVIKSYLKLKITVKVKSIEELNTLKETLAESYVVTVLGHTIKIDEEFFYIDMVIKPWVPMDIAAAMERHVVSAPGKVYAIENDINY